MLAGSIWVVDGDPVIGIGRMSGWEKAYCAGKGLSAVKEPKTTDEKRYDLVFIDKAAPGKSELVICRKIGKIRAEDIHSFMSRILDCDHTFRDVSFVYVSGRVVDLYKPFVRQEILAMIQGMIRGIAHER